MPEENRVFDVAKPGYGQAQATSKPVIVGHQPETSDPMVRDNSPTPTKISVQDDNDAFAGLGGGTQTAPDLLVQPEPQKPQPNDSSPALFDNQPESNPPIDPLATGPVMDSSPPAPEPKMAETPVSPPAQVEALPPAHAKRRSPFLWVLLSLIVALIVVYVLLGTGAIRNSLNLPPFKKKAAVVVPQPATKTSVPQSSLPSGFSKYNLSGTTLTFAAPTAWGTPSSTTDPGYSKRGGTNQSDGTHAYIVSFPNNKDIELAVTAAKYLPASRDALYYDYLQWCTGTADGKYYESTLQFATAADKTQTPTTATCDHGPLTGVTLINPTTIVQLGLKNNNGQPQGDLYTMNLTNTDLPVIRVKDAVMKNSAAIKQLLNTVQTTGSSTTKSSSNSQ